MGRVTHVVTILKLAQILPKMRPTDMDMCPVNPALQLRPKAFDGIDTGSAWLGIFTGVDHGSRQYLVKDKGLHILFAPPCDNASDQFTAPLQHSYHSRLIALVTTALARNRAADVGFINFNRFAKATKRVIAIQRSHIFADFMTHAPRRLVGNADLALNLFGGDTIAGSAEQKDDIEPIAQRRPRSVERRIGCGKDLMAAIFTAVTAARCYPVKMGVLSAFAAVMAITKTGAHKMLKATVFCWKTVLELADCRGFCSIVHTHYIAQLVTWRKGINTKQVQGRRFDHVNSSWRKILADAKIKNFRWHDMRHHFASRFTMAGVDLNTIRELLGHSDYAMTLRYAHLALEQK